MGGSEVMVGTRSGRRTSRRWRRLAVLVGVSLAVSTAHANSTYIGNVHVKYNLRLGYGLAVRTGNASDVLINGPVDAFQSSLLPSAGPGQPPQVFRFTHTDLPVTINFDDGDRNFKRWALINNRATTYGQLHLDWNNYGLVLSGDAFYDQAYHGPNDNGSPTTVNKLGPNGEYPDPHYNRFTHATRHFDGQRARVLEAYGYGDWNFGSQTTLDLRVGRQLVAWGQSLFFSGLALAQSRADATKSFVPGADVKSILLPTNQVAVRLGVTPKWTLLGYYKLEFAHTELFPAGDYFSPSDIIGPGASFVYSAANPLAGSDCPGLFSNIKVGQLNLGSLLTSLGLNPDAPVCNTLLGAGSPITDPVPFIIARRGPNITPGNWGQFGVGTEYQITSITTLGFYYLRYADSNPTVQLNVGYAPLTKPGAPVPLDTGVLNEPVPVSYNVRYFGGIHMYSLSFSTVLGPFNVGGEFNYRDGVDMPVATRIAGVVSPIFTRGKLSQILLSALYVANPNFFYDDFIFTGETGFVHVNSIDRVAPSPGIEPLGNGRTTFYSKNAWGTEVLMIPTKHNVFDGWDISTPVSVSALLVGTPSMAGAFGALYGEGDIRLGAGVSFQYLQNLKFSFGYNFFFGNEDKMIGQSTVHANPYVDRDYATFSITYHVF